MLTFDPRKRFDAKKLLENPLFDPMRNKAQEQDAPFTIDLDEDKDVSARE